MENEESESDEGQYIIVMVKKRKRRNKRLKIKNFCDSIMSIDSRHKNYNKVSKRGSSYSKNSKSKEYLKQMEKMNLCSKFNSTEVNEITTDMTKRRKNSDDFNTIDEDSDEESKKLLKKIRNLKKDYEEDNGFSSKKKKKNKKKEGNYEENDWGRDSERIINISDINSSVNTFVGKDDNNWVKTAKIIDEEYDEWFNKNQKGVGDHGGKVVLESEYKLSNNKEIGESKRFSYERWFDRNKTDDFVKAPVVIFKEYDQWFERNKEKTNENSNKENVENVKKKSVGNECNLRTNDNDEIINNFNVKDEKKSELKSIGGIGGNAVKHELNSCDKGEYNIIFNFDVHSEPIKDYQMWFEKHKTDNYIKISPIIDEKYDRWFKSNAKDVELASKIEQMPHYHLERKDRNSMDDYIAWFKRLQPKFVRCPVAESKEYYEWFKRNAEGVDNNVKDLNDEDDNNCNKCDSYGDYIININVPKKIYEDWFEENKEKSQLAIDNINNNKCELDKLDNKFDIIINTTKEIDIENKAIKLSDDNSNHLKENSNVDNSYPSEQHMHKKSINTAEGENQNDKNHSNQSKIKDNFIKNNDGIINDQDNTNLNNECTKFNASNKGISNNIIIPVEDQNNGNLNFITKLNKNNDVETSLNGLNDPEKTFENNTKSKEDVLNEQNDSSIKEENNLSTNKDTEINNDFEVNWLDKSNGKTTDKKEILLNEKHSPNTTNTPNMPITHDKQHIISEAGEQEEYNEYFDRNLKELSKEDKDKSDKTNDADNFQPKENNQKEEKSGKIDLNDSKNKDKKAASRKRRSRHHFKNKNKRNKYYCCLIIFFTILPVLFSTYFFYQNLS